MERATGPGTMGRGDAGRDHARSQASHMARGVADLAAGGPRGEQTNKAAVPVTQLAVLERRQSNASINRGRPSSGVISPAVPKRALSFILRLTTVLVV